MGQTVLNLGMRGVWGLGGNIRDNGKMETTGVIGVI